MKWTPLLFAFVMMVSTARAEDWTTTDGTSYQDVRVIRVEDDAITITYKDGGALIPLFKLPPPIQKKFDYDPVKAKIAAEQRTKADAENARLLQIEFDKTAALKLKQQIADAKKAQGITTPQKN